jgi:hypothetical protein
MSKYLDRLKTLDSKKRLPQQVSKVSKEPLLLLTLLKVGKRRHSSAISMRDLPLASYCRSHSLTPP